MLGVGELEDPELLGHTPVGVRQEREVGSEPCPEGAVHVRLVGRDRDDLAVPALDLVLHVDEAADSNLLLGTPPPTHERDQERPVPRNRAQRHRLPRVVRERDVRNCPPERKPRPSGAALAVLWAKRRR